MYLCLLRRDTVAVAVFGSAAKPLRTCPRCASDIASGLVARATARACSAFAARDRARSTRMRQLPAPCAACRRPAPDHVGARRPVSSAASRRGLAARDRTAAGRSPPRTRAFVSTRSQDRCFLMCRRHDPGLRPGLTVPAIDNSRRRGGLEVVLASASKKRTESAESSDRQGRARPRGVVAGSFVRCTH